MSTTRKITYYPSKQWSFYVALFLTISFFAAPLVYAILNMLSTPNKDSPDTLYDDHTRQPPSTKEPPKGLSDICDLDPATLVWYTNK